MKALKDCLILLVLMQMMVFLGLMNIGLLVLAHKVCVVLGWI